MEQSNLDIIYVKDDDGNVYLEVENIIKFLDDNVLYYLENFNPVLQDDFTKAGSNLQHMIAQMKSLLIDVSDK